MNSYYCLFLLDIKKDEQLDHVTRLVMFEAGAHALSPVPEAGLLTAPASLPCGCHAELDSHRPDPLPPSPEVPKGLLKPGQRTKDSFSHSQPGNLGAI